nr:efflux RND transporter permease subunit [uncultured Agathobaculum sp.]
MKLNGHNPVDLIINHRKLIEKIFTVLVLLSLICAPMVGINYDLTKYLPDSSPSAQALDIMEDEFTYPGMGRVMLKDVTLYEAKNIKDRIADVDGVDMVMWADLTTNIYGSSEFIDYDDIDDYYHEDNQTAYMDIVFKDKDSSSQTHKAIRQIEQIVGEHGLVAGSATSDTNLGPTINKEVARVMVLAVIIIYIILTITTTSWFEPVMFLSILGIAIVINMGTNIFLGEISFLSNAVGAVLQLACSMDYSIFLLHAFTQERAQGIEPEQAMANAWRSAFSSVFASGMTTIVGFAAMCLMNFGIGPDMGIVLAKGIAISLATVLLLMPALILRFQDIVAKTKHRPFIPTQSRGIGNFAFRIRRPLFIAVLLIIIPCYVAQGMANFSYGNEAVANSPGTPVYEAEQQMNAEFGKSNMMIALVPLDSNLTEKQMTDEIDDLPYVKYALSLSSVLPEGIPEDFLPENITSIMHSEHWARVIINVRSSGESEDAFHFADSIRAIVNRYYPGETTYLVGVTPSTQDIKSIIVPDYNRVNIVSLLGVALVVALTYKALILPLVVLIPIECAIFINTALPYIYGQRTMYLGFIIVGCIQLGATVDYSILMTGNYLDARTQGDKKEAAIRAVSTSAESVMTSGMIVMTVAYGLYFMTSVEAISSLGRLIGRGAFISVIMVLFFLPMCLMIFDRFIVKPDHAERKHAKMNRIHAMKIKLPTLSALHEQRLRLHQQIRENRHARHKQTRAKLNSLLHGKGYTLPEQSDEPQQTETQSSGRTLPKRVRMRLKARLDKRRARLSDLISAKKNDNEQSNTEENDNEKK